MPVPADAPSTQPPPSVIKDPSLAPSGHRKIQWVARHMPVVNAVTARLAEEGVLAGQRITICLHLEAKTAHWALRLQEAGAQVAVCGSNPLSTQDDVCAALAERGVAVYATHDCTPEEYKGYIHLAVAHNPTLLVDDGGDLVQVLHTDERDRLPYILGGSEETTTGVIRLRAMAAEGALAFPMMATNDARSKFLFDNRHGTGQSVWAAITAGTNLLVAGKVVVVAGYGWCGKGVAQRAQGLGARVIVCEVDPVRATEALMDGHQVMPALEAAALGDFFITTTGCKDVFHKDHFARMKDGAMLANAGHFDVEINIPDLAAMAVAQEDIRPNVREYRLADGRSLFLLAQGRLVNLAGGDGHPAEIMDMSFAVQSLALRHLALHHRDLKPGVHPIPPEVDGQVCMTRLEALGIGIDRLTPEQQAYLSSWRHI